MNNNYNDNNQQDYPYQQQYGNPYQQPYNNSYPQQMNNGYYQQGGYPPQMPFNPYYARMNPGKGTSEASLVLGILSIVSFMTIVFPFLFGIIGLILGIVSRSKSNKAGFPPVGTATGGIVCSVIGLVLVAFMVFLIIFAAWEGLNYVAEYGTSMPWA